MPVSKKIYLSFGVLTLLVGGLALAGLLYYGWSSGQELPLWPALAVALVNIVGAIKLVMERKKIHPPQAPASKHSSNHSRSRNK